MILLPILVVSDAEAAAEFYGRLGFPVRLRGRTGRWVELDADAGARLGIHQQGAGLAEAGRSWLSLATEQPLEELAAELREVGIVAPDGIVDEAHGRSMTVYDPDGTPIEILELDEGLYT